jgi:predicted dehydrogenase
MRFGLIGCGKIGIKRAESMPNGSSLVGCYDNNFQNAKSFASKFNVNAYKNLEDLINCKEIEAVIVATTHDKLSELTKISLNASRHVFVEKPGAISYSVFKAVAKIAKEKNLKIHVGYNHRYHPAIIDAFKIVAEGSIGPIMFIRGRYGHGGRVGYEKEWRANKLKSGGGELVDQGTHLLDLAIGLLGPVSLDYSAIPTYFWDMQVEDNAFLSVKNSKGSLAFLHASCTEWKNMFSLEIYGETGKLEINGLGRSYGLETLTLHKMKPEMGPPETETWTYPESDQSWMRELKEFINDIETGSNNSDNVESSLEILRIIEEVYQKGSE